MTVARRLAPVAWLTFLAALLVVLWVAGHVLPVDLRDFDGWAGQTDPLLVAFGALRLALLAVAAYSFGCTLLSFLGATLGSGTLATVADFVSTPELRRINRRIIELSLVGVLASPASAFAAQATSVDAPVLRNVSPVPAPTIETHEVIADPTPEPEPTEMVVVVKPGENLWSIAQSTLRERLGRKPSNDELTNYWRQMIELNRANFAEPSEPDLIFAGQTLTLP